MPFANNFRAMLGFPFPGDMLGDLTVECVEVDDAHGTMGGHAYSIYMVLQGPGGVQGVRRALKPLFESHPLTFSAYGNPYQLWCCRPEIEGLGDRRYAVRAMAAGVRVFVEEELVTFLAYLDESGLLTTDANEPDHRALAAAYMERYRADVRRQLGRYRGKLRRERGK